MAPVIPKTCEACGVLTAYFTQVRTTNGGLFLCKQCLDDINRKSPLLAAAQERIKELESRHAAD